MALLGVDEIWKFVGIADEEHRRVIADHIPVAFVSVELESEAAHIALGIRRTTLTSDRGEAQQAFGFRSDFAKEPRF